MSFKLHFVVRSLCLASIMFVCTISLFMCAWPLYCTTFMIEIRLCDDSCKVLYNYVHACTWYGYLIAFQMSSVKKLSLNTRMYSYSQIHDFTNDIGKDKCYIVFRFAAEAFKYSCKQ